MRSRHEHDVLIYSPIESAGGPSENLYLKILAEAKAEVLANASPVKWTVLQMGALIMLCLPKPPQFPGLS